MQTNLKQFTSQDWLEWQLHQQALSEIPHSQPIEAQYVVLQPDAKAKPELKFSTAEKLLIGIGLMIFIGMAVIAITFDCQAPWNL